MKPADFPRSSQYRELGAPFRDEAHDCIRELAVGVSGEVVPESAAW